MERVVIAVVLVVVALIIAMIVNRRRPDAPTQGSPVRSLPQQLDRGDFDQVELTWLVAVFSSDTCDACSDVVATVQNLRSDDVHIVEISWQADRVLHDRYGVDTVPATVIAGPDGVVEAGFLGPMPAEELDAAMEAARSRRSN